MNFENFMGMDGNISTFLKQFTDAEFKDIYEALEECIEEGLVDEPVLRPTFIAVGINPRDEGIEVGSVPFDFADYNTPSELRKLREFAKELVIGKDLFPIAGFIVAEASSYSPNEEEVEEIRKSDNERQAIEEIARRAKEEGRQMDAAIVTGLTTNRDKYFFSVRIDRDEGSDVAYVVPEEEARGNYPARIVAGTEDSNLDGDVGKATGSSMQTIERFLIECRPFMIKRMTQKLPDDMLDRFKKEHPDIDFDNIDEEIEESMEPSSDHSVAKNINKRSRVTWDTDE